MPVIDVHNHIVPEDFPSDNSPNWPCMECGGGHRTMMISGKAYRQFDERNWSAAARRDYMDGAGIDIQVLSPLPELLSYWLDPAATEKMAHHVNGKILQMIDFDPARFQGLAMIPLQDPVRGAKMLQDIKDMGFKGVEIGSNINGKSPADPFFDEFWATANALDLAVFIHGIKPAGAERLVGPDVMAPLIGVPLDTALCVSSCISANISQRFPRTRLGFSHGGGAIGAVIDRFSHVWKLMPELRETVPVAPEEALRDYYFDILTFGADYLKYMLGLVGKERIIIGTDYPAGGMGLMDPLGFMKDCGFSENLIQKISSENALRFLG